MIKKYLLGSLDKVLPPARAVEGEPEMGAEAFPEPEECLMVFVGMEACMSKQRDKLTEREVFAVAPTIPS